MKILLIEDSQVLAAVMVDAIESVAPDTSIDHLDDGDRALQHVTDAESDGRPFDLVLLDRQLPGADGFEVLRRLREISLDPPPPAIMVSSSEEEAHIDEAYRLGANAYVVKSWEMDTLRQRIRRLTRFWAHTAALPTGS